MVLHILISVLLGLLAYYLTELIGAPRNIAVIVGLIVGILVYVGALSLT